MGADLSLLCWTPSTAIRVSAAHSCPLLLLFVRTLPVYPTVRLGAALMLRFDGWYPSYRCPTFILLVGVAVTITDAGRSRDSYLAVCWHKYITSTCGRDTTTICLPPWVIYVSFPSRHIPPHPLFPLPCLQTTSNNMSTSEEAGYSGLAEVFHAPQPGCPRDRESSLETRASRRGEPQQAGSGDETEDGPSYHHPDPPTKRVDRPVRAENKTDQPLPDSGASRRQLSSAPGESQQLPPPRSTGHYRRPLGSPRSAQRHP